MGQVAVVFKIMPSSTDIDAEMIKKEIEKKFNPSDIKIQELAFGIKVIKALFIIPDASGVENIENGIKEIEGVGEVETESLTLV